MPKPLIVKMEEKFVFTRGKHLDETLEEVAKKDPSYLTWVFTSATEELADDEFHHLEDVMYKHKIEFFPEKKRKR